MADHLALKPVYFKVVFYNCRGNMQCVHKERWLFLLGRTKHSGDNIGRFSKLWKYESDDTISGML